MEQYVAALLFECFCFSMCLTSVFSSFRGCSRWIWWFWSSESTSTPKVGRGLLYSNVRKPKSSFFVYRARKVISSCVDCRVLLLAFSTPYSTNSLFIELLRQFSRSTLVCLRGPVGRVRVGSWGECWGKQQLQSRYIKILMVSVWDTLCTAHPKKQEQQLFSDMFFLVFS